MQSFSIVQQLLANNYLQKGQDKSSSSPQDTSILDGAIPFFGSLKHIRRNSYKLAEMEKKMPELNRCSKPD